MEIWTTFAPSKVAWELSDIRTKGKKADGNWLSQKEVVRESLEKLKEAGISGIRLVIYPAEIKKGKDFNWIAVNTALEMCHRIKLKVILCIGPFQYPYYPGIYLPTELLNNIPEGRYLDEDDILLDYGMKFLEFQLKEFGWDKRIYGFHFANEWPDAQNISGKENIKKEVSPDFMKQAAEFIKSLTSKPVFMNTNIDASEKDKVKRTFSSLLEILGDQGKLGFDVYPSQETWSHVPLQKTKRLFESYQDSVKFCREELNCELFFGEVEAQPWGDGRSWYRLIAAEEDPGKKILEFSPEIFHNTWEDHIKNSGCSLISLWGSDFWLAAESMDLKWPLDMVCKISKQNG